MFKPLNQEAGQNLTRGLVEALGRSIVLGEFQTSGFANEADITAAFSVSRSVAREAVKMLTAKGLLRSRPRRGLTVQPEACWNMFDLDVLDWMLCRRPIQPFLRRFTELRLGIEPAAAGLAAAVCGPDTRQIIQAAYRRLVFTDRQHADHVDALIAFHATIFGASCNSFYIRYGELLARVLPSLSVSYKTWHPGSDNLQLQMLTAAIIYHNRSSAEKVMRLLIEHALDELEDF